MSVSCFLALGSNLRNPKRQLALAIYHLRGLPKSEIIWMAPLTMTEPLGCVHQPNYCNTILEIKTTLTPHQLLSYCQKIENKQGRVRKKRWGSRTLDIDILTFGYRRTHHAELTIPHPGIRSRPFIYEPLLEYAPSLSEFI